MRSTLIIQVPERASLVINVLNENIAIVIDDAGGQIKCKLNLHMCCFHKSFILLTNDNKNIKTDI